MELKKLKNKITGNEEAKNKSLFHFLPWILLFLALVTSLYLWKELDALKTDPQKIAEEEVTEVVNQVSKLMVLPQGEVPILATVSNLEELKDQPFFANAKLGDKVLIYSNAKKVILYNPETNKIIEVAPLNIGENR